MNITYDVLLKKILYVQKKHNTYNGTKVTIYHCLLESDFSKYKNLNLSLSFTTGTVGTVPPPKKKYCV